MANAFQRAMGIKETAFDRSLKNQGATAVANQKQDIVESDKYRASDLYKNRVATGQELAQFKGLDSLPNGGVLAPQATQISPWYDMAAQKYQDAQAQTLAAIPQQQNSATQQAQNMLAMRGGLGAGVGARLGGKAEEAAALARQGVLGQGESDMASLGMQKADANTIVNQSNATSQLGANQFNVGNQIANQTGINEYNKYKYGQEMKVLGANNSAYALQNAAGGGKK